MKAAFLVGQTRFEVREVADAKVPDDGLVLKVEACGVCGSDLRRWREGPLQGAEPLIAGHEIAGIVVEVGSQLREFYVGERLAVAPDIHCGKCYYCKRGLYNLCDHLNLIGISPGYHGGFAEKMVLTAEVLANGIVHRIPTGMGYVEGAVAEPCSSVLAAHSMTMTSLQDVVVVMGAGPIGCLHVAIAKSRGARVLLSEPSEARRQMAARFSPDIIVDPFQDDLVTTVLHETDGVGADIAICANPVAATHTQAVQLVRKRGKVVLFGGLPKENPITSLDANRIHYGEIEVLGSFSYHPTFHELALQAVQRGLVPIDSLVTHTFPLTEIDRAFNAAAGGQALKVIINYP